MKQLASHLHCVKIIRVQHMASPGPQQLHRGAEICLEETKTFLFESSTYTENKGASVV